MNLSNSELISCEVKNIVESLIKKLGVVDYNIEVSPGSIKGDNYLGIIAKVVVTNNNNNSKIFNFIVKSAPQTGIMRMVTPVRKFYEREIYIYETVLSEFQKFQSSKKLLNPFGSYAKYYSALIDENNESIVLENMKEHGFRLWDRRVPYDYNHILLAIREYGKLHALSFAIRDQNPNLFNEMTSNLESISFVNSNENVIDGFLCQGKKALATLDPVENKIAYEKYSHFLDNMIETMLNLLKSKTSGKYGVIIHGDCWINNILYKFENNEKPHFPTKLCFLDWQLSGLGSPVQDLSYLIFSSTDREIRDEKYDTLIREYYNSFSTFLIELGSDPQKLFPYEILLEHLKRFSIFGLFMSISILSVITRESEDIPDVNSSDFEGLKKRMENHSDDEKLKTRMKAIILDFVKFGYI